MQKAYQIGDGWLVVRMSAAEASAWNNSTLRLADLRNLMARRSDETRYRSLGDLLDSRWVSRDDLTGHASR